MREKQAMDSTVSLYNLALARLGGDVLPLEISSQEDGSVGRLCQVLFPQVLDVVLERHVWSFARSRKALASVPGHETVAPYRNAYMLPADCMRPLYLESGGGWPDGENHNYVIEGGCLFTNTPVATLVYVRRENDVRKWPATFADVVAWGLAAELATARINDPQRQQAYWKQYEYALVTAEVNDMAFQRRPRPASAWGEARRCVKTGRPTMGGGQI